MGKIVVFSNMYPSAEHPTYGIFVKNQVEQLKSAGLDIEVRAIFNPGKGKAEKLSKYMSWVFSGLGYLLKHSKVIQMTHAHYAFPTGLLSLFGKKFLNIPYIVTVHGGDLDKMAKKNAFIGRLTRCILRGAAAVITVGEKLRQDAIADYGVKADRVEVMSMGVNTEVFKPMGQEEARLILNIPVNDQVILFVGNVIEEKGIMELLDAFSSLQQTHSDLLLYIVGSQKDERFAVRVKEKIEETAMEGVYIKEPVTQTELAKWMAASDVLALPSYHEGFGLVALEALASGAKVVASSVGGLPYLLQDGAGILVEPRNAVSLAEGLAEALENEETMEEREKIQQIVKQHASETIIGRLDELYSRYGKR